MNYPVIYEKIEDSDFPKGYYYAHIPTLGLTTHGEGIEGAKSAALDLLKLWLTEDVNHYQSKEYMFATLEV
jgi:predicted RNase H-like HicB family nuclease